MTAPPATPRGAHHAVGAATTLLLLLTGAACGGQEPAAEPSKSPSARVRTHQTPSGPASSQSTPKASGSSAVPVYYLGDTKAGLRLFREFHRVPTSGPARLQSALSLAVENTADDPDYRTGFPHGTTVRGASTDRRTVTVDLSGPNLAALPAGSTRKESRQALNALVFTADGVIQANAPVAFRIDGRPADTVLGIRVGPALERANPDKVKSTISVFSPAQGATVRTPFTVEGEAATFEANVVWELMQGDKVVRHGFTTARECCTLAPYSFTVKKAPPGRYTLVVHDTNEATGEGVGTSQDTKDITVR